MNCQYEICLSYQAVGGDFSRLILVFFSILCCKNDSFGLL